MYQNVEEPYVPLGMTDTHPRESLKDLTYSQNSPEHGTHLLSHTVGYRPKTCITIKKKSISQANGHDGSHSYAHWTPDGAGHHKLCKR